MSSTAPGLRARPLDAAEQQLFAAARLHAVHALMPYLATAVFRLEPWAVDGLGTFGVDAAWRVYLDPEVLDRWGVPASAGVLLHEVGHALRGHAALAATAGPTLDRHAWNLCGDAAINDDLVACGVPLPDGPVLPEHLVDRDGNVLRDGGTARSYYDALPVVEVAAGTEVGERPPGTLPQHPVVVVPGRGGPDAPGVAGASCGGVAGGEDHGVRFPADAAGVSPAAQDLTRRAVAADIQKAGSGRSRGTVPLGLRRWASEQLADPVVSWQDQLRGAVRRGVAHVAGNVEPTYARPSRRRVPGIVLPGGRRPVPSVAIVLDTSGSMHRGRLDAALAEVEGIVRVAGASGQRVRVIEVDAAVHAARSVTSTRQLTLSGGGGTELGPGLEAAVATRPAPDVVVVCTDGLTPWPARSPRSATRWIVVLVGDAPVERPPPWATTIRVEEQPRPQQPEVAPW